MKMTFHVTQSKICLKFPLGRLSVSNDYFFTVITIITLRPHLLRIFKNIQKLIKCVYQKYVQFIIQFGLITLSPLGNQRKINSHAGRKMARKVRF